jgi:hypothetical protein
MAVLPFHANLVEYIPNPNQIPSTRSYVTGVSSTPDVYPNVLTPTVGDAAIGLLSLCHASASPTETPNGVVDCPPTAGGNGNAHHQSVLPTFRVRPSRKHLLKAKTSVRRTSVKVIGCAPSVDTTLRPLLTRENCAVSPVSPDGYTSRLVGFVERDKKLISSVLTKGVMPPVEWGNVRRNFAESLSVLLGGRRVRVTMFRHPDIDPVEQRTPVDLDELMRIDNTDAVVVHGESMVFLCTLSSVVCSNIRVTVKRLSRLPDAVMGSDVVRGILATNVDGKKKGTTATALANFGAGSRAQAAQKVPCKKNEAVITAMGCRRGGRFIYPPNFKRGSLTGPVREVYSKYFASQFSLRKRGVVSSPGSGLLLPGYQTPSLASSFERNDGCPTFGPLLASIPPSSSLALTTVAAFENTVRALSEQLLLDVFGALPYATSGFVMRDNLREAVQYADTIGKTLPFKDLCRALPKGSVGTNTSRHAHEDDNGAITPSMWMSLYGHDGCCLTFFSRSHEFYFRTTTDRFCLFYGWVPHSSGYVGRTDHSKKSVVTPTSKDDVRIHHSGYNKPLMEFIGLSLFSDSSIMREVIDEYEEPHL